MSLSLSNEIKDNMYFYTVYSISIGYSSSPPPSPYACCMNSRTPWRG